MPHFNNIRFRIVEVQTGGGLKHINFMPRLGGVFHVFQETFVYQNHKIPNEKPETNTKIKFVNEKKETLFCNPQPNKRSTNPIFEATKLK